MTEEYVAHPTPLLELFSYSQSLLVEQSLKAFQEARGLKLADVVGDTLLSTTFSFMNETWFTVLWIAVSIGIGVLVGAGFYSIYVLAMMFLAEQPYNWLDVLFSGAEPSYIMPEEDKNIVDPLFGNRDQ